MTNLFQRGSYKLASGLESSFKIECDALTDADLDALCYLLFNRIACFKTVIGIPTGGVRIAQVMQKYSHPDSVMTLIVDDVYTSGGSIARYIKENNLDETHRYFGAVLFARTQPPSWITPLFTMTGGPG